MCDMRYIRHIGYIRCIDHIDYIGHIRHKGLIVLICFFRLEKDGLFVRPQLS